MFGQNPAQAIGIRFTLMLVITLLLFNAVQPVFAAAEIVLTGGNISNSGAVELVGTLQAIGETERHIFEFVSHLLAW